MNKEVIIFDMDGLMFDTENLVCQAQMNLAKKLGLPFTREYYLETVGMSDKDCLLKFADDFGDYEIAKILTNDYRTEIHEIVEKKGVPHKLGLLEILAHFKELNKILILASSNRREEIQLFLATENLTHYFSGFVSAEDVAYAKPHPEIFERAAILANFPKQACLVLEDSLNGVRAAHAAGIDVIMVPDLVAPDDEAREKTIAIVNTLNEVRKLF